MIKSRLKKFTLLSLILHAFIFLSLQISQHLSSSLQKEHPIEVTLLSPDEKAKFEDKMQIVDQNEKALNDELDDKAKFLSAHNQKVKKETSAQNKGEFKNATAKPPSQSSQKLAAEKPTAFQTPPKVFDPLSEMDHQFKTKQIETIGQNPDERNIQRNQTNSDLSQTNDYLKDVDKGIETLLNTKEFKYYTYFNRIRRQLSQYWEPKVKEKLTTMFRQGRKIASEEDKITKLLITLNNQGILIKVQVLSDSGVRDLDEAAIDAFRAAAPFPNPPKGIIDPDGTVKIRWDFILES